jgi:hypothetical protein
MYREQLSVIDSSFRGGRQQLSYAVCLMLPLMQLTLLVATAVAMARRQRVLQLTALQRQGTSAPAFSSIYMPTFDTL